VAFAWSMSNIIGPLEVGEGAGYCVQTLERLTSPGNGGSSAPVPRMVELGSARGVRSRDTGAPGEGRYHWTVTVFGEPDPVATGRTGEPAGARSRAEGALHAYTDAELSSHGRSVSG
jgi:hypothetical protein